MTPGNPTQEHPNLATGGGQLPPIDTNILHSQSLYLTGLFFNFTNQLHLVTATTMAQAQSFGFYPPPLPTVHDDDLVAVKAASQATSSAGVAGPTPQAPQPQDTTPNARLTDPFGPVYVVGSPLHGNLAFVEACAASPYEITPSPFPVPPNSLESITPSQSISQHGNPEDMEGNFPLSHKIPPCIPLPLQHISPLFPLCWVIPRRCHSL